MSDKQLADIICNALLGIVAGIRKKYGITDHKNIVIVIQDQSELHYAIDNLLTIQKAVNSNEIYMPSGYNVSVDAKG